METRASYLIVGGFVLALIAGILAFALWLGGQDSGEKTVVYYVEFQGTVSGLQVGSTVLYRGIPVGSVTAIDIGGDGNIITATTEIREDTPVKEDTEAFLEHQLLTGVAVIQLSGGSPEAPLLSPPPGKDVAVIRARASTIEEITESAPELIDSVGDLVDRAQLLFSDDNMASITGILKDVNTITSSVASRTGEIETIIDEAAGTVESLGNAMNELELLASDLRIMTADMGEIIKQQTGVLEPTVAQVKETAAVFSSLARDLNTIVKDNERAINDFASGGLYELTRFLTEARDLVAALQRLTEQIERDPARFLFGDQQRGVNVQ